MPQPRIINITRSFHLKRNAAYRGLECGAYAWVEKGVSVRDMTLAEQYAFRNEQNATREPLACAELPGLSYSGSTDYAQIRAAHEFVTSAV